MHGGSEVPCTPKDWCGSCPPHPPPTISAPDTSLTPLHQNAWHVIGSQAESRQKVHIRATGRVAYYNIPRCPTFAEIKKPLGISLPPNSATPLSYALPSARACAWFRQDKRAASWRVARQYVVAAYVMLPPAFFVEGADFYPYYLPR